MTVVPVGIRRGTVRLVAYQPHWHRAFARERRRLVRALGALPADIQHVGSTAIPGMSAKPLLDITVGVKSRRSVELAVRKLERAGYRHITHGDTPGRVFMVRMRGEWRTKHLSVTAIGSLEWRNHVGFRDYLISHPAVAAQYHRLKRSLARRFAADRGRYTAAKASFVRMIVTRAGRARQKGSGAKNR